LGRRREWRSGKAAPKAKLLIADNQYLFRGRKNLNTETIWYNPDFREDFWESNQFNTHDFELSVKNTRIFLKALSDHSSGQQAMAAMRILAEGWSSHDVSHRILRSWTAFEIFLSRSPERADRYEEIIDRAVYLVKDKKLWKMILLHAALTRNRYVHENEAGVSAEAVASSLDDFFAQLLGWILFMKVKFESHQRLLDTLSLSADLGTLRTQAEDRERALQLLDN
jgi:hypothetical protein